MDKTWTDVSSLLTYDSTCWVPYGGSYSHLWKYNKLIVFSMDGNAKKQFAANGTYTIGHFDASICPPNGDGVLFWGSAPFVAGGMCYMQASSHNLQLRTTSTAIPSGSEFAFSGCWVCA